VLKKCAQTGLNLSLFLWPLGAFLNVVPLIDVASSLEAYCRKHSGLTMANALSLVKLHEFESWAECCTWRRVPQSDVK
jgi:hypothetical protein